MGKTCRDILLSTFCFVSYRFLNLYDTISFDMSCFHCAVWCPDLYCTSLKRISNLMTRRAAESGAGGGGRAGGRNCPGAPALIGPQRESESLKLSRFFKLVGAFLKLRPPYSSSTCGLAKV